jgi:hypothetical protein
VIAPLDQDDHGTLRAESKCEKSADLHGVSGSSSKNAHRGVAEVSLSKSEWKPGCLVMILSRSLKRTVTSPRHGGNGVTAIADTGQSTLIDMLGAIIRSTRHLEEVGVTLKIASLKLSLILVKQVLIEIRRAVEPFLSSAYRILRAHVNCVQCCHTWIRMYPFSKRLCNICRNFMQLRLV